MESLKLNDGKTEFLIIGTLQQLEKFDIPFLSGCELNFPTVAITKHFSSSCDSRVSMAKYVTKIVA